MEKQKEIQSMIAECQNRGRWQHDNLFGWAVLLSAVVLICSMWLMAYTLADIYDAFGTWDVSHHFGEGVWVQSCSEGLRWIVIPSGEVRIIAPILVMPALAVIVFAMRPLGNYTTMLRTDEDVQCFVSGLRRRIRLAGIAGFLMLGAVIVGSIPLIRNMFYIVTRNGFGIQPQMGAWVDLREPISGAYFLLMVAITVVSAILSGIVLARLNRVIRSDVTLTVGKMKRLEKWANILGLISAALMLSVAVPQIWKCIEELMYVCKYGGEYDYRLILYAGSPVAVTALLFILNRYRRTQSTNFILLLDKEGK